MSTAVPIIRPIASSPQSQHNTPPPTRRRSSIGALVSFVSTSPLRSSSADRSNGHRNRERSRTLSNDGVSRGGSEESVKSVSEGQRGSIVGGGSRSRLQLPSFPAKKNGSNASLFGSSSGLEVPGTSYQSTSPDSTINRRSSVTHFLKKKKRLSTSDPDGGIGATLSRSQTLSAAPSPTNSFPHLNQSHKDSTSHPSIANSRTISHPSLSSLADISTSSAHSSPPPPANRRQSIIATLR
ncbi:hypothetical protein HK097_000845, partial [Rhizophlyctis rosea]